MEKTIFELGTIELGGYVYVTDPSYSPGIWCQALIKNVKSGKYHAFMNKVTIPNWGRVVSELWVCHEDSTKDFPNTFVAGVEYLLSNLWTSVDDKLPKLDEDVVVYYVSDDGEENYMFSHRTDDEEVLTDKNGFCIYNNEKITHWQKLTKPQ